MTNRDRKKKVTPGTIIAVVILILLSEPELFAVVLAVACIGSIIAVPFLIIRFTKKQGGSSRNDQQNFPLDDCPKSICFHKDKGEHHVRAGKEIDPWDRPDIDISKYQRK